MAATTTYLKTLTVAYNNIKLQYVCVTLVTAFTTTSNYYKTKNICLTVQRDFSVAISVHILAKDASKQMQ
jgi:hypothetical protein